MRTLERRYDYITGRISRVGVLGGKDMNRDSESILRIRVQGFEVFMLTPWLATKQVDLTAADSH